MTSEISIGPKDGQIKQEKWDNIFKKDEKDESKVELVKSKKTKKIYRYIKDKND